MRPALRPLERADVESALEVCARNTVANLFVSSRLLAFQTDPRRAGGEVWGWYDQSGDLASLCWSGANLVPVEATPEALEAIADRARRIGRQCSSIVGVAADVLALWALLRPYWGAPREIREDQPLMAIAQSPEVLADPEVRRSRPDELGLVLPACVAMFTEEVGYSPLGPDGGALYQAQVAGLVAAGRSFVRVGSQPDAEVIFKAELGSVTPHAVQVQGVWVNPRYRGAGLAAPGVAAVVDIVRREMAPVVSLYVNGFNHRAISAYRRVGFSGVGTFATVLF